MASGSPLQSSSGEIGILFLRTVLRLRKSATHVTSVLVFALGS
jgi:hypothetical protein